MTLDIIMTVIYCYLKRENCKVLKFCIIFLTLQYALSSFEHCPPISTALQSFKIK